MSSRRIHIRLSTLLVFQAALASVTLANLWEARPTETYEGGECGVTRGHSACGWPWKFHDQVTYDGVPEPADWDSSRLALDLAVGLGIVVAACASWERILRLLRERRSVVAT